MHVLEGFFKPCGVVAGDGHHPIQRGKHVDFLRLKLGLEAVEEPAFGSGGHVGRDFVPQGVLHIVRAEHKVGVAQTANGRDVSRGEQGFQEHHVVNLHAQRVFHNPFHFWRQEPRQVVALARDQVGQGVPDVQLGVGVSDFELGLRQIAWFNLVRQEGVLVRVDGHHLHFVSHVQKPLSHAVHRQAAAIHGWAWWLVADLQDA